MSEENPPSTRRKSLVSIAPARRASVEDAFDSSESDWSDSEDDKAKVLVRNSTSSKVKTPVSSVVEDKKNNQPPPPKHETLSLGEVIEAASKEEEDAKVVTVKAEVFPDKNVDDKNNDNDDWDDDSEMAPMKESMAVGSVKDHLTEIPAVLKPQPQEAFTKRDVVDKNKSLQKQSPVVDVEWSPSESAGDVSDMDECQEEEPEPEQQQSKVEHVDEDRKSERGDGDSIFKDAKMQSVASLFEAKSIEKSEEPKATSSTAVENMENYKLKEDVFCVATKPSTSQAESTAAPPSSSFAASLSSSTAAVQPAASNPAKATETSKKETDSEKGKIRKRSKSTSSTKGFFSKLLSSESSKSGKKEAQPAISRKSSEPAALSTLLLDTPVKSAGSGSNSSRKSLSPSMPPPMTTATTTSKRSRSRASSGPPETDLVLKHALTVPGGSSGKQKGLLGKIKKTFGVRPKARLDGSLSNLSVPNAVISGAISDPCLSPGEDDTPIIAIKTKGRAPEQVIVDLLMEGKQFMEKNANPHYEVLHYADAVTGLTLPPSADISQMSKTTSENSINDLEIQDVAQKVDPKASKMSYYCSQADEGSANRQVIHNLVEDFMCIVNKSFGTNDKLKTDLSGLMAEMERLRCDLEAAELAKRELERKMQEYIHHNTQLQYCLDEECQARKNLEQIIQELRAQCARQDCCLNTEVTEKTELISCCRQLEVDLQNFKNQVCDLECERDELIKTVRGSEKTKTSCADLQKALAECCQHCDLLQKQLFDLREEYRQLEGKLDKALYDNNVLCKDLEFEKQRRAEEKDKYEAEICRLQEAIASLERSKTDTCSRMNDILKQHHEEMDKLSRDGETYKAQVEELRKANDDLQKRLRDCEGEKKRKAAAQQVTTANEVQVLQKMYDDEKKCSEDLRGKLKEAEEERQKNNNNVETEIASLKAALHVKDAEAQDSKSQLEKEKREKEDLQKKLKELEEANQGTLNTKERGLEGQILTLQESLKSVTEVSEKRQSQLEKEKQEKEDLQKKLKELEEARQGTLNTKERDMEDQILSLQQSLKSVTDVGEKAQSQLEEERKNRQELERKLQEVADARNKEREQILEKELQDVRESLQAEQEENERRKTMYEEEKKAKEELEKKLKESEEAKNRASNASDSSDQAKKLEKEIESLRASLQSTKDENDLRKSLYEEEKKEKEALERKLKASEEAKQRASKEQEDLANELRSLRSSLQSLKKDHESRKSLHDIDKQEKEELEKKLSELENSRRVSTEQERAMSAEIQKLRASLKSEKEEGERRKSMYEEEKKAKEELERKLSKSEDTRGPNDNMGPLSRARDSDILSLIAGLKSEKNDIDQYKALYEKEKQEKEELQRRVRKSEEARKKASTEQARVESEILSLKAALQSEKELVIRITNKLENTKAIAKNYKAQVDEALNDPKTEKLNKHIENLKSNFEVQMDNSKQEKEKLLRELYKVDTDKWKAERAAKKLNEEVQIMQAELTTWKNLAKMKDRIEIEFVELKRAINDQFVDKKDVEKLRNAYEEKLKEIKAHYERELQRQISETLSQYSTQIERQTRDRNILEKIRGVIDVNENSLRKELSSVTKSMHTDIDKLKSIIRERDEQIISLKKSLEIVKDKYADESRQREALMKRLQITSSHSSSQDLFGPKSHSPFDDQKPN